MHSHEQLAAVVKVENGYVVVFREPKPVSPDAVRRFARAAMPGLDRLVGSVRDSVVDASAEAVDEAPAQLFALEAVSVFCATHGEVLGALDRATKGDTLRRELEQQGQLAPDARAAACY